MTFEELVRTAINSRTWQVGPHASCRASNWDETGDWLTTRAINCLNQMGFQSLYELKVFEPSDVFRGMVRWPNSGSKTATEVARLIAKLRAAPPEPRSISHWGMF